MGLIFTISHDRKTGIIKMKYPSRSRKGLQHTLTAFDNLTGFHCECEAGQKNRLCWHKRHAENLLSGIFNENIEVPNEQV